MTTATMNGVDRYIEVAKEATAKRAELRAKVRKLRFDTIAVHGMYGLEEAFTGGQGGIIEPIFPSTSQAYRDSDEMEAALSYQIPTWCYSRIHNPTVFYLEETLALLESYGCATDATGLCTSSGMSAIKQAVEPLVAKRGDEPINFVSTAQVYGGTFQLFNLRMAERGAEVRWVTEPWRIEAWEPLIDEHTRFLYAEMPSNPQQACTDLEAAAELAHSHGIPLIVDATVATPALMRPLAHGADIVVHSLSKTAGAGGNAIAGGIVARHGLTSRHLDDDQRADYALWLKLWPFRDSGPCMTPISAHYLLNEMRTLRIKMAQMSQQHHGGGALSRRPPQDRAGRLPRAREPPAARAGLALHEGRRRRHAGLRPPHVLHHSRFGGGRPGLLRRSAADLPRHRSRPHQERRHDPGDLDPPAAGRGGTQARRHSTDHGPALRRRRAPRRHHRRSRSGAGPDLME